MTPATRLAVATLTLLLAAVALADPKTTHTGVLKSARIELRYRPNSYAAATAERTLAAAERDLDRIGAALDLKPAGPFTLYVYDDVPELVAITGKTGVGGFSADAEVHAPYDDDQTRLHEMVHVVAHAIPKSGDEPRNQFFAEGLANAVLEHVFGVHVHAVAAFYLKQDKLPALPKLVASDFYALQRADVKFNLYDVAASWFRFLLDRFGAAKVKVYYSGTPLSAAFGAGADELEKAWREMLGKYPLRAETEALLRARAADTAAFPPYVTGLPADVEGKPSDWTNLTDAAMSPDDAAKWTRGKDGIAGTNPDPDWTVCELGDAAFADCAIRARVRTAGYCALRVQAGKLNAALLVGPGTFLFRDAESVGRSTAATMAPTRRETDFVLVRRAGKLDVWIDGVKVLTGRDVPGDAKPGIGVAQGSAVFTDVRVRKFAAPAPR